jgi:hypothetical protein
LAWLAHPDVPTTLVDFVWRFYPVPNLQPYQNSIKQNTQQKQRENNTYKEQTKQNKTKQKRTQQEL